MQHYSYLLLLFALFVVPRVLQRYRVPTAITSLGLGLVCALQGGYFVEDPTVKLFSTLGIVSLFLFAGLDVEFRELRENASVLVQHIVLQILSLVVVTLLAMRFLDQSVRPATLLALALLTPSAGFILDSLGSFGLPARTRFWIKSKAIATELVALGVLFVTLQSSSAARLSISSLALVAMIAFLPLAFRSFAVLVLPHAPKSEFAFLLMVAVACAVGTYELGVYYLVGAFIVGMAAQRLRERLPAMASERMLSSVESFASLFVPFYFFHAGLSLSPEDLGPRALGLGLFFGLAGALFRLVPLWLHRRVVFGEPLRRSLLVGIPMLPTLVFTLVLASILRERFTISPTLFGGLVVYAIVSSLVPGLVFRRSLPDVEDELLQEDVLPGAEVRACEGIARQPRADRLRRR